VIYEVLQTTATNVVYQLYLSRRLGNMTQSEKGCNSSRSCCLWNERTVPQLSIMIIYNSTWSILIKWIWFMIDCQVGILPSKYKRKRTSCMWFTLSHEQKKYNNGGNWSLAKLCITCEPTTPMWFQHCVASVRRWREQLQSPHFGRTQASREQVNRSCRPSAYMCQFHN